MPSDEPDIASSRHDDSLPTYEQAVSTPPGYCPPLNGNFVTGQESVSQVVVTAAANSNVNTQFFLTPPPPNFEQSFLNHFANNQAHSILPPIYPLHTSSPPASDTTYDMRHSLCKAVINFVVISVGIGCFAVGIVSIGKCPASENLPFYMTFMGLIILGVFVLLFYDSVRIKCSTSTNGISEAIYQCLTSFLILIGLSWYVFGNIWILKAIKSVQFSNPDSKSFCNETIYISSILFNLAVIVLSCVLCCSFILKLSSRAWVSP